MPVATFDTLKSSKALREAGVPEKQADAQVAVLAEAFSLNLKELATKEDLGRLEKATKDDLKALKTDLTHELELVGQRLKNEIVQFEQRLKADHTQFAAKQASDMLLVKWMFGAIFTTLVSVGVKLFFFPAK